MRQQVWSVETDGDIATNFFRQEGITFSLTDLKQFGILLQDSLINPTFFQRHEVFRHARIRLVLERHGQNVSLNLADPYCFKNLARDFDLKYNWSSIESVSFAWTCEIFPEVEVLSESYDNSLFISREGASKVMKSGTITEYCKGGLQNLCNYQSSSPFINVQKFINNHNVNEPQVKISGEMVWWFYLSKWFDSYSLVSNLQCY